MPEYNSWNQNEDEETPLVKRLRQEIEQRDKRMKDLDDTVNKLTGQVRTQSLSDVLREIGAKPGLAKFVPSGLETSKESVTSWLKENEELFGPFGSKPDEASQTQTQQTPQATNTPITPQATPEQIAAFQRMGHSDNNTTSLPDLEQTQISQLGAMHSASSGDFDTFMAYLRGDKKLT